MASPLRETVASRLAAAAAAATGTASISSASSPQPLRASSVACSSPELGEHRQEVQRELGDLRQLILVAATHQEGLAERLCDLEASSRGHLEDLQAQVQELVERTFSAEHGTNLATVISKLDARLWGCTAQVEACESALRQQGPCVEECLRRLADLQATTEQPQRCSRRGAPRSEAAKLPSTSTQAQGLHHALREHDREMAAAALRAQAWRGQAQRAGVQGQLAAHSTPRRAARSASPAASASSEAPAAGSPSPGRVRAAATPSVAGSSCGGTATSQAAVAAASKEVQKLVAEASAKLRRQVDAMQAQLRSPGEEVGRRLAEEETLFDRLRRADDRESEWQRRWHHLDQSVRQLQQAKQESDHRRLQATGDLSARLRDAGAEAQARCDTRCEELADFCRQAEQRLNELYDKAREAVSDLQKVFDQHTLTCAERGRQCNELREQMEAFRAQGHWSHSPLRPSKAVSSPRSALHREQALRAEQRGEHTAAISALRCEFGALRDRLCELRLQQEALATSQDDLRAETGRLAKRYDELTEARDSRVHATITAAVQQQLEDLAADLRKRLDKALAAAAAKCREDLMATLQQRADEVLVLHDGISKRAEDRMGKMRLDIARLQRWHRCLDGELQAQDHRSSCRSPGTAERRRGSPAALRTASVPAIGRSGSLARQQLLQAASPVRNGSSRHPSQPREGVELEEDSGMLSRPSEDP